jgi:hypothetical protein
MRVPPLAQEETRGAQEETRWQRPRSSQLQYAKMWLQSAQPAAPAQHRKRTCAATQRCNSRPQKFTGRHCSASWKCNQRTDSRRVTATEAADELGLQSMSDAISMRRMRYIVSKKPSASPVGDDLVEGGYRIGTSEGPHLHSLPAECGCVPSSCLAPIGLRDRAARESAVTLLRMETVFFQLWCCLLSMH